MRKRKNQVASEITLHIFVCTNERRVKNKSCGGSGSRVLYKYLKERIRVTSERYAKTVKVNETGCLSNCANGPVLVCYPQGVWYSVKTAADIDVLVSDLERTWMAELRERRSVAPEMATASRLETDRSCNGC